MILQGMYLEGVASAGESVEGEVQSGQSISAQSTLGCNLLNDRHCKEVAEATVYREEENLVMEKTEKRVCAEWTDV